MKKRIVIIFSILLTIGLFLTIFCLCESLIEAMIGSGESINMTLVKILSILIGPYISIALFVVFCFIRKRIFMLIIPIPAMIMVMFNFILYFMKAIGYGLQVFFTSFATGLISITGFYWILFIIMDLVLFFLSKNKKIPA